MDDLWCTIPIPRLFLTAIQSTSRGTMVYEGEARRGVFSQCALIFCEPHCVAPTNTYCCCWHLSAGTLYIEFEDHWHKKYSDSTIKTNWIKRDWLTEMLWVLCGVVLLGCCCYNAKGANALRFVFFVVVVYMARG